MDNNLAGMIIRCNKNLKVYTEEDRGGYAVLGIRCGVHSP